MQVPIESPVCQSNTADGTATDFAFNATTILTLNTVVNLMRVNICNQQCEVPDGLDSSIVRTSTVGGFCEMSIALEFEVETFLFSNSLPSGPEQQECFDSTLNIINNCIDNSPNTGFWNGDHVLQFYQAGVRPLNGDGNRQTDIPFPTGTFLQKAPTVGVGLASLPPPTPTATPPPAGGGNEGPYFDDPCNSFPFCLDPVCWL